MLVLASSAHAQAESEPRSRGKQSWELGPFVKRPQPILSPTPDSRFHCPVHVEKDNFVAKLGPTARLYNVGDRVRLVTRAKVNRYFGFGKSRDPDERDDQFSDRLSTLIQLPAPVLAFADQF